MKSVLIVLAFTQLYGAFCIHIPFQTAQDISTEIAPVSNAITNAIYNVTLWQGGRQDARLNLLIELQTLQIGLQQSIHDTTESFLNGTITTEYRLILAKLNYLLKTHLNHMNNLITILIPTMKDLTATHAITSCLDAGRAIEKAMENIHLLLSS